MSSAASPPDNDRENAAFFDAIYTAHHRVLYAYLLGHVVGAETAADLLQETFLRVWRHIDDARQVPAARLRYWLFSIARNLILDQQRRRAARLRCEEAVREQLAAQPSAADLAQALICREAAASVDAAIAALPEGLRLVLTLYLVGDMTSAEIGECLQRPAGTVRYQIGKARREVARQLTLWSDNID